MRWFYPPLVRSLIVLAVILHVSSSALAQSKKGTRGQAAKKPPAASVGSVPGARTRVALMGISGLGLDNEIVRAFENYLRNSMATMEGVLVIPPVDIQMALQSPKHKAAAECGAGARCASLVGTAVGADRIVFGTMSAVGQSYGLSLRVVEVKTGRELGRHQVQVSGSRDALIPEVRLAAYRLLAPDKVRGSLLVDCDVGGATVEVDGAVLGTTPLGAPIRDLEPGPHLVVVKKAGYSTFQQELVIKPFEATKVRVLFQAQPAR